MRARVIATKLTLAKIKLHTRTYTYTDDVVNVVNYVRCKSTSFSLSTAAYVLLACASWIRAFFDREGCHQRIIQVRECIKLGKRRKDDDDDDNDSVKYRRVSYE